MDWKTVFFIIAICIWIAWYIVYKSLVLYEYKRDRYGYKTNQLKEEYKRVVFPRWFLVILICTIWVPILNVLTPLALCSGHLDWQASEYVLRFKAEEDNKLSQIVENFANWIKSFLNWFKGSV